MHPSQQPLNENNNFEKNPTEVITGNPVGQAASYISGGNEKKAPKNHHRMISVHKSPVFFLLLVPIPFLSFPPGGEEEEAEQCWIPSLSRVWVIIIR